MSKHTLKTIGISLLIIVITATTLLAMGRTPTYKYGSPTLWSSDVVSNQNSQQLTDPYSFTHLLHGVGFYAALVPLAGRLTLGTRGIIAVALESGWEIFENTDLVINRYREETISLDYYGDSVLNSIGDILVAAFAFWLTSRLPTYVTVIGIILIEIILLFWIRDSLLLNIIMLIYPVPAIKTWQLSG